MADWFIVYLLAMTRCYGFFAMLPQIGEVEMPYGAKLALIATITPFLAAPAVLHTHLDHTSITLLLLVGKELLLGMFLGFLVSLPLRLPQLVGDLIDNQRGAAVTAQYNPGTQQEDSILGQLLTLCVVVYFFSEGGFDRFIGILSASFALQSVNSFEFGAFGDGRNFYQIALLVTTNYLQLFAILCTPLMLVMLCADLSLGIASKFAQSLNVFSLSQSVKAVIAIGMLISLHPRLMAMYLRFFDDTVGMLFGAAL